MYKARIKYSVYRRYTQVTEDPERDFTGKWEHIGDTLAVSEKQAINNCRYRTIGNVSQYKALANGGHWESYYEYRAVPA